MPPNIDPALVIVLFVIFGIGAVILQMFRGQTILEKWADENGFKIVSSERRSLSRGPFFFTTGRGQEVYYVTIKDGNGRTRSGYVRCGSFLAGVLSDKAVVRWDDE